VQQHRSHHQSNCVCVIYVYDGNAICYNVVAMAFVFFFSETIVAKKSKTLDFLRLQELDKAISKDRRVNVRNIQYIDVREYTRLCTNILAYTLTAHTSVKLVHYRNTSPTYTHIHNRTHAYMQQIHPQTRKHMYTHTCTNIQTHTRTCKSHRRYCN
jgi:hypothetical protein